MSKPKINNEIAFLFHNLRQLSTRDRTQGEIQVIIQGITINGFPINFQHSLQDLINLIDLNRGQILNTILIFKVFADIP